MVTRRYRTATLIFVGRSNIYAHFLRKRVKESGNTAGIYPIPQGHAFCPVPLRSLRSLRFIFGILKAPLSPPVQAVLAVLPVPAVLIFCPPALLLSFLLWITGLNTRLSRAPRVFRAHLLSLVTLLWLSLPYYLTYPSPQRVVSFEFSEFSEFSLDSPWLPRLDPLISVRPPSPVSSPCIPHHRLRSSSPLLTPLLVCSSLRSRIAGPHYPCQHQKLPFP